MKLTRECPLCAKGKWESDGELMMVRQTNFTVDKDTGGFHERNSWYRIECRGCGHTPSYMNGIADTPQEAIDIWQQQS